MTTSEIETLYTQGVVVIPIQHFIDNLPQLREEFENELMHAPEFIRHPGLNDLTKRAESRYNIGGTAVLGHPSVFHNALSRKLRNDVTYYLCNRVFREYIATYAPGAKLETVIDRIMCRPPLDVATKESWHRDESPYASDADMVFGGWLNLDLGVQRFSCVLGTHHETSRRLGFAKIPTEQHAEYNRQKTIIEIPPGNILIFSENIVHEILSDKSTIKPYASIRQFIAYRITHSTEPLVGREELNKTLNVQAACRIKSGQMPRLYPKVAMIYTAQRENKDLFIREMTIGPEYIDRKTHNFVSLSELGHMYPAYEAYERQILIPGRRKLVKHPVTGKYILITL